MRRVAIAGLALATTLPGTGCAIRVASADGRVHTVGLVWTSQPAPPVAGSSEQNRTRFVFGPATAKDHARWLELKAAGIILERTPNHAGVTIGYRDAIWVFPEADAVTAVDADSSTGEPASVTIRRPQ